MHAGDVAGIDRVAAVGDSTALREVEDPGRSLELVSSLCRALQEAGVRYCHWKSNESLDRSASGENDLDLLVHRSDARRFEEILRDLGFRDALLPRWKELPGVYHSYAVDRGSGRFVHIHAHYQLVVGDDMTKNYHLPIEVPYLASARPVTPFLVPAPEFELGLFLLRMVIKHCTWDAFLTLQSSLSRSERRELDDLLRQVDLAERALVHLRADGHALELLVVVSGRSSDVLVHCVGVWRRSSYVGTGTPSDSVAVRNRFDLLDARCRCSGYRAW